MKTDLTGRKDIELLVDTFYAKVTKDETIGYFFNKVTEIDWEKHMPTMYDFWETTLFYKTVYNGNPIQVHQELNEKSPILTEHFERWIELFSQTIDELFEGPTAELAKTRALSIATVMKIKIMS